MNVVWDEFEQRRRSMPVEVDEPGCLTDPGCRSGTHVGRRAPGTVAQKGGFVKTLDKDGVERQGLSGHLAKSDGERPDGEPLGEQPDDERSG